MVWCILRLCSCIYSVFFCFFLVKRVINCVFFVLDLFCIVNYLVFVNVFSRYVIVDFCLYRFDIRGGGLMIIFDLIVWIFNVLVIVFELFVEFFNLERIVGINWFIIIFVILLDCRLWFGFLLLFERVLRNILFLLIVFRICCCFFLSICWLLLIWFRYKWDVWYNLLSVVLIFKCFCDVVLRCLNIFCVKWLLMLEYCLLVIVLIVMVNWFFLRLVLILFVNFFSSDNEEVCVFDSELIFCRRWLVWFFVIVVFWLWIKFNVIVILIILVVRGGLIVVIVDVYLDVVIVFRKIVSLLVKMLVDMDCRLFNVCLKMFFVFDIGIL